MAKYLKNPIEILFESMIECLIDREGKKGREGERPQVNEGNLFFPF